MLSSRSETSLQDANSLLFSNAGKGKLGIVPCKTDLIIIRTTEKTRRQCWSNKKWDLGHLFYAPRRGDHHLFHFSLKYYPIRQFCWHFSLFTSKPESHRISRRVTCTRNNEGNNNSSYLASRKKWHVFAAWMEKMKWSLLKWGWQSSRHLNHYLPGGCTYLSVEFCRRGFFLAVTLI